MNPQLIQFLIQILGLDRQNLGRPGQSLHGQEAAATPSPQVAQRYAPLLGGSEASFVQNPDSTRNYAPMPKGPYGPVGQPEDPLIQILQFLMKPQS